MITLERPYKIIIGTSQCTNCGKGMKKSYIGLNSSSPICSSCVNVVFNLKIDQQELSIQIWLVEVANKYVLQRLYLTQYRNVPLEQNLSIFAENFYSPQFRVFAYNILNNNIYINGKRIKEGWIDALRHHLMQRRVEIQQDMESGVRSLLVCSNCKKPMFRTGRIGKDEHGAYQLYHCLAGKSCANCNSKTLFAYYRGTDTVRRLSHQEAKKIHGYAYS